MASKYLVILTFHHIIIESLSHYYEFLSHIYDFLSHNFYFYIIIMTF